MSDAPVDHEPKFLSTCVNCWTPLICTFEVKFKEWYCMECEQYFEWLHTSRQVNTEAYWATYQKLLELFKTGARKIPSIDLPS